MSLPPPARVAVRAIPQWTFAAALLAGCPADGEVLPFKPVGGCFKVEQPAEKVFRTAEEWEEFHRNAALRPPDGAPAVDFAQKMIVAHFDGSGSACVGFTVESVAVGRGALTVQATRNTSPNPCIAVVAYPQVVLEVPRRDLPVRFRIRDIRKDPPAQPKACF